MSFLPVYGLFLVSGLLMVGMSAGVEALMHLYRVRKEISRTRDNGAFEVVTSVSTNDGTLIVVK